MCLICSLKYRQAVKPTLPPLQGVTVSLLRVKRPGPKSDQFYLAPRISTTGTILPFSLTLSWRAKGRNFIFLHIKLGKHININA